MKSFTKKKVLWSAIGLTGIGLIGFITYKIVKSAFSKKHLLPAIQMFSQQFFSSSAENLPQMIEKLDQILIQYLNFGDKLQTLNPEYKNKSFCGQSIKTGQAYFMCQDCSITYKKYHGKDADPNCEDKLPSDYVHMAQCEECFDPQVHQGHKFQRKDCQETSGTILCDCGDNSIIISSGNCQKHCGTDKKQYFQDYEETFSQELKEQLSYFFRCLFDEFFLKLETILYNEEPDKRDHINNFLNQILTRIEQLMEMNFLFARYFKDFLLEKSNSPHLHDCQKTLINDFDQVQDACSCAIFERLIRFSQYYTNENNQKIHTIVQYLVQADQDFKFNFGVSAFRMFDILFYEAEQLLENNITKKIKTPVPVLKLLPYSVCQQEICGRMIDALHVDKNKNDILNALIFYSKIIMETEDFLLALHFELIENVLNIAFEVFRFASSLVKLLNYDETIILLFKLALHIDKQAPQSIVNSDIFYQWSFYGVLVILVAKLSEIAIKDTFFKIFHQLKCNKSISSTRKQQVTNLLIQQYKESFKILKSDALNYQRQRMQYIPYCSTITTLIIEFYFLESSELPTKENQKKAYMKIFELSETEVIKFLKTLSDYMSNFLFFNPNGFRYLLLVIEDQTVGEADLNTVAKGVNSIAVEASFSDYDHNLLCRQMLGHFESETNTLKERYLLPYLDYVRNSGRRPVDQQTQILESIRVQNFIRIVGDTSGYMNNYACKTEQRITDPKYREWKKVYNKCKKQMEKYSQKTILPQFFNQNTQKELVKGQIQEGIKRALITILQNSDGFCKVDDLKKEGKTILNDQIDIGDNINLVADYIEEKKGYQLRKEYEKILYQSQFMRFPEKCTIKSSSFFQNNPGEYDYINGYVGKNYEHLEHIEVVDRVKCEIFTDKNTIDQIKKAVFTVDNQPNMIQSQFIVTVMEGIQYMFDQLVEDSSPRIKIEKEIEIYQKQGTQDAKYVILFLNQLLIGFQSLDMYKKQQVKGEDQEEAQQNIIEEGEKEDEKIIQSID